jgi:cytochrome c-type protein NapB
MNRMKPRSVRCQVAVVVLVSLHLGCRPAPVTTTPEPATAQVRATRRAYDGAPPVIPHPPLGADCIACHTTTGKQVPTYGFAPANPHLGSDRAGSLQNCRQCHLFQRSEETLVANSFAGTPQAITRGTRAYAGAPPTIPHSLQMRENCAACHVGASARPEIRCTHPERSNCRQCHLASEST